MAITQPMIITGPATSSAPPTPMSGTRVGNWIISRPRMAAKTLNVMSTRSVPKATVGM